MHKIIILSASTGGGHNQAAISLAGYFKAHEAEVKIIDFLEVKGKILERVLVGSYSLMYSNLPNVYSRLYSITNNRFSFNISSFFVKAFESEILKIFIEENPQLIIATHPLIVDTICKLKDKRQISAPFISVITDFKAHRLYLNASVDAYITASEYTRKDLIQKGINRDKIYSYGLPLKQDFLSKTRYKRKNKEFTVLVMGGSNGHSTIEDVLKHILSCRNPLKVIIICGTDKKIFSKLKNSYPGITCNKKINILGYTDKVAALMDEADLLISKPGGLTVSEAISKNLPMFIPFMLPGQEQENAAFLVESGCAKVVGNIDTLHYEIDSLIENPDLLMNMKQKMSELYPGYSCEDIITLGAKLIEKQLIS